MIWIDCECGEGLPRLRQRSDETCREGGGGEQEVVGGERREARSFSLLLENKLTRPPLARLSTRAPASRMAGSVQIGKFSIFGIFSLNDEQIFSSPSSTKRRRKGRIGRLNPGTKLPRSSLPRFVFLPACLFPPLASAQVDPTASHEGGLPFEQPVSKFSRPERLTQARHSSEAGSVESTRRVR